MLAVLGGFFLTNALIAEIVGGKVIWVGPEWLALFGNRLAASVGVLMWPVVFVTTDLVNEYFGRRGVRRLTFLTVGMIAYAFVVLYFARLTPTAGVGGVPYGVDEASFDNVLGTSQWIIVGSLTAFLVSQLVDVTVFHVLRKRTGRSLLWLRSTGSTVVSQAIDSVIVLYIGLALPRGWSLGAFWTTAFSNYAIKLVIAVLMTPVIYGVHHLIDRYLGEEEARRLTEAAARGNAPIQLAE